MATSLNSFLNTTGKLRDKLRFSASNEFEETISDWIKERREVAIKILKENDNYSTGALANSITPKPFTRQDNTLLVEILADSYWKFIDKGVNGVFKNQGSQYSFKNLGVGREMKRSFKDFIRNKGITELRYIKNGESVIKPLRTANDYDSASYVLARAVKKKGIEGNEFMSIAYSDEAIKDLSKRLELDVVRIFNSN